MKPTGVVDTGTVAALRLVRSIATRVPTPLVAPSVAARTATSTSATPLSSLASACTLPPRETQPARTAATDRTSHAAAAPPRLAVQPRTTAASVRSAAAAASHERPVAPTPHAASGAASGRVAGRDGGGRSRSRRGERVVRATEWPSLSHRTGRALLRALREVELRRSAVADWLYAAWTCSACARGGGSLQRVKHGAAGRRQGERKKCTARCEAHAAKLWTSAQDRTSEVRGDARSWRLDQTLQVRSLSRTPLHSNTTRRPRLLAAGVRVALKRTLRAW